MSPIMSFSKAVELVRLAAMAASRSGVTLAQIKEEFGCSERTAQRMTEALCSAFAQTERFIVDDRKAHWRLPSRAISPLLHPTADELVALDLAVDELKGRDALTEATALRTLSAKIRALIDPVKSACLDVDEEALLEAMGHATRPGPRPALNPQIDAAIATALKACNMLRIVYKGRNDEEPRARTVEPYGLLLGVRRYLVARDPGRAKNALRHFRVEDIVAAEVLAKCFRRPADFNLERHARKAFMSFQREEEHGEVVWRFAPRAAERARRYQFHPDQIVDEEGDGSLIVRFKASGHLEMCWHLYSWGDTVEVVSPPELAALVHPGRRSDFASLP